MNCRETLEDCIQSVAHQTATKEHVLIDGNSTDGTLQLIEQYSDHFSSTISEPDRGIYDAMNKGIGIATGEVIGFLNSDDFYPNSVVLEKVAQAFENPLVDACYGDLKYVDRRDTSKSLRYWKSDSFDRRRFYHGWMPPHPTFFVRKTRIDQLGLFNLQLGSAADYEFMLRYLLKNRLHAVHIPEVLVHMRSGGVSNASFSNRIAANRNDRKAWRVNDLRPYAWTLMAKPLRKVGQWLVKR